MDFIKNWTFCICITLIISIIFIVLTPKGSMGKFYKIIISIFIFISFLYPLTEFDFNHYNKKFNFKNEYSDVVENSVDIEIKNSIKNILKEKNIKVCDVVVNTSSKDNEVTINKVLVLVTDEYSKEQIKDVLLDNLGLVVEVKYVGE